jgi:hypothetical protein
MSSAKRRAKRKIRQLVRMDQTRQRMAPHSPFLAMLGGDSQAMFFTNCMVPLGKKLGRLGLKERATKALADAGTDLRHTTQEPT